MVEVTFTSYTEKNWRKQAKAELSSIYRHIFPIPLISFVHMFLLFNFSK